MELWNNSTIYECYVYKNWFNHYVETQGINNNIIPLDASTRYLLK